MTAWHILNMLVIAALLSGLCLAAAHRWRWTTGLLTVAFLPFLMALVWHPPGVGWGALAGLSLGLAYAVPLVIRLRFPLRLAVGLSLYLSCGFVVVGALAAVVVMMLPALVAAPVVALVIVMGDRLTVHVVPAWGTAQSWVRPLSRWVSYARVARPLGQPVAMLALVLPQTLVAVACTGERAAGVAAMGVLLLVWIASAALARFQPRRTVRVAALGWDWQRLITSGLAGTAVDEAALIVQPIIKAAMAGARVVVTPETGLNFSSSARPRWIARLSALTAEHNITLVVGYLDQDSGENRAGVFTPAGLVAEYAKTHLVWAAGEHLTIRPGRGALVQVDVDGVVIGVLICHDDNFTGPARRHARAGTQVLMIPTNDWAEVKEAHLENVPWRAIENRMAIVRGASNGISAIIGPDGRIIEHMDHTHDGVGVIIGDVPVR